ncbi:DUF3365 domain-containing protein [Alishewanella sp. 16-MA]|uniref:DUF3365 domain-containing protein n=1 Tax=Alishewanella maricola TaxID=2795740 RepID=A0ABS8C7D8_9ALTE|nr:DUF3365 domain-containing protein [Alishewanella maricola]MCB5227855.1 DUF3365 domain-containing protein [Alishewanella maricola]
MRIFLLLLLCGLSQMANAVANDHNLDSLKLDAQTRIKGFATELKSALGSAIKQGGLSAGVAVCQEQAPMIAAKWSTDGWEVGRTSLRVRNSANIADPWEQNILQSYITALAAGADATELQHAEIVNKGEGSSFRYMQPIMLEPVCQACHGNMITEAVLQTIQEHYPADLATGFEIGELRGAFTLKKRL